MKTEKQNEKIIKTKKKATEWALSFQSSLKLDLH